MKWIKENGTKIETNDLKATIAYCKSLGWEVTELPTTEGGDKHHGNTKAKVDPVKTVKQPVSLPKKQVLRAGKI